MTTIIDLKTHVHVTKQCKDCGTEFRFCFRPRDWRDYISGTHVQAALPELSADDRELFITGICGTCFDKIFPDEG